MNRTILIIFGIALIISYPKYVVFTHGLSTDPSEVSVLKAVRSKLIDPTNSLISWTRGDPCTSNWAGVYCYSTSNDTYLHIRELQLLKLNLSGNLAPELGLLSQLQILDFMWNQINGTIPKEIGNITSLRLLLLNGNQLSGSLPEELGSLSNLNRLQIDQNQITGPIPKSFANLSKVKHMHMNNNSLTGPIPSELSALSLLFHFLVDNNNLSGFLPPEFGALPNLKILQLDNNNFSGSSIPDTYTNIKTLLKLSLRNCSFQGTIPDFSRIPQLGYLDLSWNQLTGPIPSNKFSSNITTIVLSNNFLNGTIPANFSGLPKLQRLLLENNHLNGSVPSSIWQNMTFSGNESLVLDFQNNSLTEIPDNYDPPVNVTVLLYGNPVCTNANQANVVQFCRSGIASLVSRSSIKAETTCIPCPTDKNYEYNPLSPLKCFCAVPLGVGFRLKSPGISDFRSYIDDFEINLTNLLNLSLYQLDIQSYIWETGPRLNMNLKLFPNNTSLFDVSEILRLRNTLAGWQITLSDVFGPYELLNFTLGSYASEIPGTTNKGLSRASVVGILLGGIAGATILSAIVTVLIMRRRHKHQSISRRRPSSRAPIKIDGLKCFTFEEMALATNQFNISTQVGQGGYGKVYKGTLVDGTIVAIKRAQEGSLQGSKEFTTEIELLSRLHHKNLVSLLGYCDELDEQMLVYEFISNGTLRDHLSAKSKKPLSFALRLKIALSSARGILYLHTEADPPIFHRDIKASNILLDSRFTAKVADFGLSRLAPVADVEGIVPGHVSTVVKGTPGYLDPEYFLTHKLTDKSDVYSLGIVFLELLTGKPPILHGKNIVREVTAAYQSETMFSIIDNHMDDYSPNCVERFISLALRCCRDETDARPSMSEVVRELESIIEMLPEDVSALESGSIKSSHAIQSPSVSSEISSSNLISTGNVNVSPR